MQRDHPAPITTPPTFLEVAGHYLLGLADMLKLVVERLIEFGNRMIEMARQPVAGDAQ